MIAKCAVRIVTESDYTFGFRGDDGSRLRVLGKQFLSSTRHQHRQPGQSRASRRQPFLRRGRRRLEHHRRRAPRAGRLQPGVRLLGRQRRCFGRSVRGAGREDLVDSTFQLVGNTAAGGLEIVRDPDTYPQVQTFTANGGNSVFVHSGVPANFTLAWTTNSAVLPGQVVSISPGIGTVAGSGSQLVASPASTTTYTLSSTLGGDTSQKSVTVFVDAPPAITSFTASDTTVTSGAAVNAELDGGRRDFPDAQPRQHQCHRPDQPGGEPRRERRRTLLVATNPAGSTQQQATVNVGAAPTINSFTGGRSQSALRRGDDVELECLQLRHALD
jgi:hypothetical protein